jgi:choline dehydrogenase-like flavoprotein
VIVDGESLDAGSRLPADVCILGAGAAGITLARELEGSGLTVVVLESGAESLEPDIQDLARGDSVGAPLGFQDNPATLDSVRLRQLGGTTNHWSGFCLPFSEVDMEVRPDLALSGWPITRAELDPWYEAAHPILRIGPNRFDWQYWAEEHGLGEALVDTDVVRTQVFQVSSTNFREVYGDELDAARDVTVYLRSNAVDLRLDDAGDRVVEVLVKTLGGVEFSVVDSQVVVVALGGIENARLLLSARSQRPAGLGNEQDLVGRHFCEHLAVPAGIAVTESDPAAIKALYEAANTPLSGPDGEVLPYVVQGVLTLSADTVRERGLLGLGAQMVVGDYAEERPRAATGLSISQVAALSNAVGPSPARTSLYLLASAEQELNPDSRVRLGDGTDALGMPTTVLDWQHTERDRASIVEGLTIIGEELGRLGLGRLQHAPGSVVLEETNGILPIVGGIAVDPDAVDLAAFPLGIGFHHMCTTRMAADPAEGVVDADLRVHSVDNLFMAGSSVFGTAGANTPTYSIVALCLRLADHLQRTVLA